MRGHSTVPWRRGRHHFQASVTAERSTGNEKAVLRFRGELKSLCENCEKRPVAAKAAFRELRHGGSRPPSEEREYHGLETTPWNADDDSRKLGEVAGEDRSRGGEGRTPCG